MNEELKRFYRAYKAWLDSGAKDFVPFSRHVGLCSSLEKWADMNGLSKLRNKLAFGMQKQFEREGLPIAYPFGPTEYYIGRKNSTQHLCPKRIAWVEKHAA